MPIPHRYAFLVAALVACNSPSITEDRTGEPARIAPGQELQPEPRSETHPTPPPSMVTIPAGEFYMGCNREVDNMCSGQETPGHKVSLDAYALDRNEVTVVDYAACVRAGACSDHHLNGFEPPGEPYQDSRGFPVAGSSATVPDWPTCNWGKPGREDHPINCVSWNHANTYCAWAGKRLPTEAEWEKAARGPDGRKYPWGNEDATCEFAITHDAERVKGCGERSSWPVGSRPRGASPYGIQDMAGNVWEWVSDYYDADYLRHAPAQNPKGPATGAMRAGKGGCWGSGNPWNLRASSRMGYRPEYRSNHRLGFRCANSVGG